MEPRESNLQIMLRYRLARFNPKRGRSWGVSLDWFMSKQHQGYSGSKVWGHISKAWKTMVKGMYQLSPRSLIELIHANIWWSGLNLIKEDFSFEKAYELYRKGIRCVDDIWDSEGQAWTAWEDAKGKFHMRDEDQGDWNKLTSKISSKWSHILGQYPEFTAIGQWLGFYKVGEEDPCFVMKCSKEMNPSGRILHHLSLPLSGECYTVGKYSRCLNVWRNPSGDFSGFFHHVKIMHTTRGPMRDGVREVITFFYGKEATLRWDPDRWRWRGGGYEIP